MSVLTSWKKFDNISRWASGTTWTEWSSSREAYAGHANSVYYVAEFAFTTPAFIGISKKITLSLSTKYSYNRYPSFRYAIVSTDNNKNRYVNTLSAVSDPNQLASGSSYWDYLSSSYEDREITIPCEGLKPNTQYVLFLWAHDLSNLALYNLPAEHWFRIEYDQGLVRIDDGEKILTAVPYIDTGTEWVRAMPYIDTGESWKLGI